MASETATQFLRNSHKTIVGLLAQAKASVARAPGMEPGVIRELCMMIEIHSSLEKELLLPDLLGFEETKAGSAAGREDLERLAPLVRGLRRSRARLDDVAELFTLHAETEERDLFLKAEAIAGLDLAHLGARMRARRTDLMSDPFYQDAAPPRVQDPNGGEQKRRGSAA